MVQVSRLDHICLSVCLSVCLSGKCTVAKRLSGSGFRLGWNVVGRRMGLLDGVVIVEGERAVLSVNFGRPIVTNGKFVA